MAVTDDFSPIVEEAELAPASGLLDRVLRRRELSPVEAGFVRVLVGEDGKMRSAGQSPSPGEKRWGRTQKWIKVDVGHHTLEYAIPFLDPSGKVGFTATVSVSVTVSDPQAAAGEGSRSVKSLLMPLLRDEVIRAASQIQPAAAPNGEDPEPIAMLTSARQHADETVREALTRGPHNQPGWLSLQVVSVSVAFDEQTARHHAELVERARRGELIEAGAMNDRREAEGSVMVRDVWRKSLLPHLSNPSQRVFEVAFANPTDQNIAMVSAQATANELALLSQALEMIETMVEKNMVDKDDPIYATIKTISGRLDGVFLPGVSPVPIAPAASKQGLDAPTDVLQDPQPEEEPGDRDWSDD